VFSASAELSGGTAASCRRSCRCVLRARGGERGPLTQLSLFALRRDGFSPISDRLATFTVSINSCHYRNFFRLGMRKKRWTGKRRLTSIWNISVRRSANAVKRYADRARVAHSPYRCISSVEPMNPGRKLRVHPHRKSACVGVRCASYAKSYAKKPLFDQLMLTTGTLIFGRISVGMRMMASGPIWNRRIARTTKV
jgi:hypothetical protein